MAEDYDDDTDDDIPYADIVREQTDEVWKILEPIII